MAISMTKEQLLRRAWLHFFNRTLLEREIISETDYRKMKLKIETEPQNRGRRC